MKIYYNCDGIRIAPETELEEIHMTMCVRGLVKELCEIDNDGVIKLRFDMDYEHRNPKGKGSESDYTKEGESENSN